MALTRGAHQPPRIPPGGVAHMDDGELLDKEGKPIPTVGHVIAQPPAGSTEPPPGPPEPPPEPPQPEPGHHPRLDPSLMADALVGEAEGPPADPVNPAPMLPMWRCDRTTMARDATGWELAQLLHIYLGRPFEIDLPDDELRRLPADAARHFRRLG